MTASHDQLLRLQELDVTMAQLRHRRASLPERSVLAEHEAHIARLDVELSELAARSAELQRTQRRLEDEVASIEAKAAETDKKLYSGSVSSPRDLQAMQAEVESLRRRAAGLEDDVLDVMEALEPVEAERSRLEERLEGVHADAAGVRHAIAEAESGIDAELQEVETAREQAAADLPAGLLDTYERLRGRLEGIAVARLDGAQCTGCHLALPATEVDAVRRAPADELVYHEECGRILVRVASHS